MPTRRYPGKSARFSPTIPTSSSRCRLDEAYLDVSEDRLGLGTARAIAEDIRRRIREETGLTASAGVSYCKFIAKLASDHRKPDGLTVITPERGPEFVASLPVAASTASAPRPRRKMERLGIVDRRRPARLEPGRATGAFRKLGRLVLADRARHRRARGAIRTASSKSVSAERTFDEDFSDPALLDAELERVARYAWDRIERAQVSGRTVTLKVKFADFTLITRSKSFAAPIPDRAAFLAAGQALLGQLHPVPKGIRLLGLGLHNLIGGDERAASPAGTRNLSATC